MHSECPTGQYCADDDTCTYDCRVDTDCGNNMRCTSLGMCEPESDGGCSVSEERPAGSSGRAACVCWYVRSSPPHIARTTALTVESVAFETTIEGQVATTRVTQVFRNPHGAVMEGTYFFPLPEDASITEFAIWEGDRRLAGEVRPRDEARRIYEDIVRRVRDPGLLEYAGRNLFQAGNRWRGDVTYSFRTSRTSVWTAYLTDIRRERGEVFISLVDTADVVVGDSVAQTGTQNLLVAGLAGSVRLG